MKCPECKNDEMDWKDVVLSNVNMKYDKMVVRWFCNDCKSSGTVIFVSDNDTLKITNWLLEVQ